MYDYPQYFLDVPVEVSFFFAIFRIKCLALYFTYESIFFSEFNTVVLATGRCFFGSYQKFAFFDLLCSIVSPKGFSVIQISRQN